VKIDDNQNHSDDLRKRAEGQLKDRSIGQGDISPEQAQGLLHELQVHQIELEMQNEELRRAQVELEISRTKYFDLFDLAPVGYLTLNEKGLILEANLTVSQLLGVERSSLVNHPLTRFILSEDQDSYYLHRKRLFETGMPQMFELRMMRRDGSPFWVLIETTSVQAGESGSLVYKVVMSDITERKQAEDLIHHQQAIMGSIINSATRVLIFALDSSYRYLAFNEMHRHEMKVIYGVDIALGMNMLELITLPEIRKMVKASFDRVLHGESFSEVHQQPGQTSYYEFFWSPVIGHMGEVKGITAFIIDITTRRQVEEELRSHRNHLEELVKERTIELEEKNTELEEEIKYHKQSVEEKKRLEFQLAQSQKMEALGRFAGGIAHDLNNILYPIIVDTELLLEETAPHASSYLMLKQILSAAYMQRDLIKQILFFSQRREQQFYPIKIKPLLNETLNLLRSSLPSTMEIHKHFDAPSDKVMGDPTQIQQVMMNLFRNAADALRSTGGMIEVSLENTYLESNLFHQEMKAGEYLRLSVKDTGAGMTSEVMDRIFEPFFTTKDMGRGNGMGLAIVHGIIKNHSGAISVESDPGKGSRFIVYLPITDKRYRAQNLDTDKIPLTERKLKILLIDDEDIILSSVKNALKRLGYDVATAIDSLEALKLFRNTPDEFDLVITDHTMPRMTGVELAPKLMEIRPDIPVILCTGFSDVIDEQEAKAMGIRGLLLKPASIKELGSAIRRALE
jgi:PAS domain S-box-containing protein